MEGRPQCQSRAEKVQPEKFGASAQNIRSPLALPHMGSHLVKNDSRSGAPTSIATAKPKAIFFFGGLTASLFPAPAIINNDRESVDLGR